MRLVAIEKARDHLELAKSAAEGLNLNHGIKAYEQAWSQFLSQASRFYSKLEQGSKGCTASEPWFGRKKHERKKDQLLSYIHHARDSDEHGLDYITRTRARSGSIKFPEAQEVTVSMMMRVNEDGSMDIKNPTVKTPTGEYDQMMLEDPRVELMTVHDRRFHDKFDPPEMHLGRPIVGRSPPEIAKLAIAYLEKVLGEASELPEHA
jgi:hypothetical protein